jgi:4-hydroxy-tetrahydrodipicolinate reductase
MSDLKIGVVGAAGRMGRMLLATVAATPGCALAGGTERPGSPALGQDLGRLAGIDPVGIALGDDPDALFAASDAVLDFTAPSATATHAALAAKHGRAHIIGTTGLEAPELAMIEAAARQAPIVLAPNMSLGVSLALLLVEQVAKALGADWDIEILEMHHRHKVDAPSGTALGLGRAAAKGRGVKLEEVSQRVRDGITGPRKAGDIGFATLRGGDVVGEHRVIFAAEGERLEIGHIATSRAIFARGAVKAALWTRGKPPGLYGMKDVLGL